MSHAKDLLIISCAVTIAIMMLNYVQLKVSAVFQKKRLQRILPKMLSSDNFELAILEVRKSFCRGLSHSKTEHIIWYIKLIQSMKIDYDENKLKSVIKKA